MNIYIIGKAIGVYRTQNFIKLILDQTEHTLFFDGMLLVDSNKKIAARIINKIKRELYNEIDNLYRIKNCDLIYQTAMNYLKVPYKKIKVKQKPLISEFYISNYDTAVNDRKTIQASSKHAKKLLKQDQDILLKSDLVLFLNQAEAEYYSEVAQVKLENINYKIIPLCVEKHNESGKTPYFKKEIDELTLCWWGTFIPLHGLEKILYSIKLLKQKNVKCKLHIFGNSDQKAKPYKKLVKNYNIEKQVEFNNEYTLKNGKLEKFLIEYCDIGLGTFGDSKKAKTVIANKILDCTSLKIPVITGKTVGLYEFFDGENDIYMIENTSEEICEKVIELSKMQVNKIKKNVENAYEVYKDNFSVESYQKKMSEVLKEFEVKKK